jgi:hypothetical protein
LDWADSARLFEGRRPSSLGRREKDMREEDRRAAKECRAGVMEWCIEVTEEGIE